MNSGRELDRLIAQKVMGLYVPETDFPNHPDYLKDGLLLRVHNYSTSIEAAWEVVEKLKEKHDFELCHLIYHGMGDAKGWFVKLNGSRIDFPQESAPHAICLAALKFLWVLPKESK